MSFLLVILRGMEFQIVGAANRKALRPMAVVVKETCKRLIFETERRALLAVFKLMRDMTSIRVCPTVEPGGLRWQF